MKVYNGKQITVIERASAEARGIDMSDLMDIASTKVTQEILGLLRNKHFHTIMIFCGNGNNGGDGLRVAQFLIRLCECEIVICTTDLSSKRTHLNQSHLKSVLHIKDIKLYSIDFEGLIPPIDSATIVVDALFGIGLNKKLRNSYAPIINQINRSSGYTLSVDLPSGMYSDQGNDPSDLIVECNENITFQYLKPSLLFKQNLNILSNTKVVVIGIDDSGFENQAFGEFITPSHPLLVMKQRELNNYKTQNGKVVIIGGSENMSGAPILSARAALNVGAGYCTLHSCSHVLNAIKIYPDLLYQKKNDGPHITAMHYEVGCTYGIGPGMGTHSDTEEVFKKFIDKADSPIVIDADGLNLISNQSKFEKIPRNSILTPHIGEFKRMIKSDWVNDQDMYEKLKSYCIDNQCIVVLKGPNTRICDSEGKLYFNSTGNPSLAVAGSGDVLTGMVTGFLAQGYSPIESAIKGVFFHGLAADIFISHHHEYSLTPSLLLNYIGEALFQHKKS